ncbi:hypothetical protein [Nocardioides sp.]
MTEHVADSPRPWTTPRLEVLSLSETATGGTFPGPQDGNGSYS